MKVFNIEFTDEVETVAAENALQAVLWYCNATGLGLSDFDSDNDIEEVPESEWAKINFTDEDTGLSQSIQEAMYEIKEPCLICSTAY